ncbi:hypothetical protein FKM82_029357 [Ascaphus truei]
MSLCSQSRRHDTGESHSFPEVPDRSFPEVTDRSFPEVTDHSFPEVPDRSFPEVPDHSFPEVPDRSFPEVTDRSVCGWGGSHVAQQRQARGVASVNAASGSEKRCPRHGFSTANHRAS